MPAARAPRGQGLPRLARSGPNRDCIRPRGRARMTRRAPAARLHSHHAPASLVEGTLAELPPPRPRSPGLSCPQAQGNRLPSPPGLGAGAATERRASPTSAAGADPSPHLPALGRPGPALATGTAAALGPPPG
nr:formin-2-like [Manis javanica]